MPQTNWNDLTKSHDARRRDAVPPKVKAAARTAARNAEKAAEKAAKDAAFAEAAAKARADKERFAYLDAKPSTTNDKASGKGSGDNA